MDIEQLKHLLFDVQSGDVDVDQALSRLRNLPYENLGFARLDLHRPLRQGLPEVVFCQGKTTDQITGILERLWQHHDRVLATRMPAEAIGAVTSRFPQGKYDAKSRLFKLARSERPSLPEDSPFVAVLSGGTSDQPVAEEAAQTAEFMGSRVERVYDVGVAGLHRLLDQRELLFQASVIISVAGMEGALTSVVGGLVSCPVVGVPTSVGYGASFDGLAALLSMLNSCAPGVAVVNIDNGFGAGLYAHMILYQLQATHSS